MRERDCRERERNCGGREKNERMQARRIVRENVCLRMQVVVVVVAMVVNMLRL